MKMNNKYAITSGVDRKRIKITKKLKNISLKIKQTIEHRMHYLNSIDISKFTEKQLQRYDKAACKVKAKLDELQKTNIEILEEYSKVFDGII
ncbi:hypothetical protein H7Y21_01025 [Arenimonas sp.]|nr:hypothetical protein [Candidatus Parcubacteria bacterium]